MGEIIFFDDPSKGIIYEGEDCHDNKNITHYGYSFPV